MNIQQMLETNATLCWDEPRPGLTSDGREIDVNLHMQMSAADAIAYTRAGRPEFYRDFHDRAVLHDFLCLHYAVPVEVQ